MQSGSRQAAGGSSWDTGERGGDTAPRTGLLRKPCRPLQSGQDARRSPSRGWFFLLTPVQAAAQALPGRAEISLFENVAGFLSHTLFIYLLIFRLERKRVSGGERWDAPDSENTAPVRLLQPLAGTGAGLPPPAPAPGRRAGDTAALPVLRLRLRSGRHGAGHSAGAAARNHPFRQPQEIH